MKFFFINQLLFLLTFTASFAQRSSLHEYMSSVRAGAHVTIPSSLLQSQHHEFVLRELYIYYGDSVSNVRKAAFYLAARIGEKSSDKKIRKSVVTLLIKGIRDPDTGIAGNVLDALTQFPADLFNGEVIASMGGYLKRETPHLEKLIRLFGYLNLTEYTAHLNGFADDNNLKIRWAARLALCRMGDANSTTYILGKLSRATIDDVFTYDVLDDLIYTRNKTIFTFLTNAMNDDSSNCSSSDPDSNKKITCAYRIMIALAPMIEHFPIKTDGGDLVNDNYESALSESRRWVNENASYVITRNSY